MCKKVNELLQTVKIGGTKEINIIRSNIMIDSKDHNVTKINDNEYYILIGSDIPKTVSKCMVLFYIAAIRLNKIDKKEEKDYLEIDQIALKAVDKTAYEIFLNYLKKYTTDFEERFLIKTRLEAL